MNPLIQYMDDELIDELQSRYDDLIIVGRQVLDNNNKNTRRVRWVKGDPDVIIGMAFAVAKENIKEHYEND